MKYPLVRDVTFEETPERLKVVLPVRRQPLFLATYSLLLLVWLATTVWILVLLFRTSRGSMSTLYFVVWLVILFILAYFWYRLGSIVWRWWQYYAATREILFIDPELLIIRRPVSLLGLTDAYAREHVGPFFYNEKHSAIAFDYGSRGALFGQSLEPEVAGQVIGVLNRRFFPHAMADEEED